jgi:hypothetical protein
MRNGRSSALFWERWATPAASLICWSRSPKSRSSMTGRCSDSSGLAASRSSCTRCSCPMASDLFAGTPPGALVHPDYPVLRAPRGFLAFLFAAAGCHCSRSPCPRHRLYRTRRPGVARNDQAGRARARVDGDWRGRRGDRRRHPVICIPGAIPAPKRSARAARSPRLKRCAPPDVVYAQHQVAWALDRLCELDGARWGYDRDELGAIRWDVMTILTHHAASRQAAMAPTAACCWAAPLGRCGGLFWSQTRWPR